MPARILLVEDEEKLAKFVQLELSYEGYEVSVAHDGLSGLMAARDQAPDLIILDWMMPGLTGVEVCRRLRQTGTATPVILLTARDDVSDRVEGLDAGADDYVVKPFSIEELLARVRAHLRRTEPQDAEILVFGDLTLDRRSREVRRGQRPIELTAKEFDLLWFLARHPRQVFNRDQLLDQVWGETTYIDPSTVTVHVRRVREKIEADSSNPEHIHTVWGVGYKFEP
jgi:two-component system OmpR family response regulator